MVFLSQEQNGLLDVETQNLKKEKQERNPPTRP